jgi:ribulose-bisphosphate carboxylase large chain
MDIVVETKDTTKYFWAKYHMTSQTNLYQAAKELAVGQSIGNPNARSVWETKEMINAHCAKILYTKDFDKSEGLVWIGFPYENIDWEWDGVSQLLCFLMGGQMDIDNITSCRLLELDILPPPDQFKGPLFGIKGIRDWTGSYGKPLFGGIIKPKTGITPEQLLDMTKQLVDGGVDFIKEDEILGNPKVCPLEKRVELISDYLNNCDKKIVYTFCINADPDRILDKARIVLNNGGHGVHVNVWSGLGSYRAIRNSGMPLFIHYQKSGDKVITYSGHNFSIDWDVLCQLAGLCGADTAHVGMLGGYSNDDEDTIMKNVYTLRRNNVVPALSCGMNPDLVAPITEKIGVDWMANVGGFIHSDPQGSEYGARKMRKAIDSL